MNDDARETFLFELDRLVRRRDRQRGALDATEIQVRDAILAGAAIGVPKLTLSQRGKVSRQTVYDMIAANEGGEGHGT